MKKLWDISPPIHAGAPVFPGDTAYSQTWVARIGPDCPVNVSAITLSPHVGAHADAPLHYDPEGAAIGAVDLQAFIGPCRVIHAIGCGPLITWQFPNVRANRARVRKAEALQQAQRAHYQGVALAALKDVRQALARFDGERRSLLAVTAALEHGQRAHALADFNYRAGALDGLALLDSERELIGLRARGGGESQRKRGDKAIRTPQDRRLPCPRTSGCWRE